MKFKRKLLALATMFVSFGMLVACASNGGHTHKVVEHPEVAATCTSAGNTAYYSCEGCDKYFSDEGATKEIEKDSWVVAALGHQMTKHDAVAETCTSDGNSEYYYCSRCEKYFSDQLGTNEIAVNSWVIPAHGHTLVKTNATEPTCEGTGNTVYYTCSSCGKHFSDANGNNEIEENSWVIAPKGHTLAKVDAVAETCTQEGNIEHYQCSECGKRFSDEAGEHELSGDSWVVPAHAHNLTKTEAVEPTCDENGNNAYYTCSECGKFFSDEDGKKEIEENSWVLAAKGHTFVANNDNIGYLEKCSECGKYGQEVREEVVFTLPSQYGSNCNLISNETTKIENELVQPFGQMLYQVETTSDDSSTPEKEYLNLNADEFNLPRINFTAYENVIIPFLTNVQPSDGLYLSFGLETNDDLFPKNAPKYAKGQLEFAMDEGVLKGKIVLTNGYEKEFTITDQDIINGDANLVLTVEGNGWRWIAIRVLLNHKHQISDPQVSTERIGAKTQTCSECFAVVDSEELMTNSDIVFENKNSYGMAANKLCTTDTDISSGAAVIGASSTSMTNGVTFPRVQYNKYHEVAFSIGIDHWSNNTLGCTLGFETATDVSFDVLLRAKMYTLFFEYDEAEQKLTGSLMISGEVVASSQITDQEVINGRKSFVLLTATDSGRSMFINSVCVSHQFGDPIALTEKIGGLYETCAICGKQSFAGAVSSVTFANANVYGSNASMLTNESTTISGEQVEVGQMLYQMPTDSEDRYIIGEKQVKLPRIDFTVFDSVTIPYLTNTQPGDRYVISFGLNSVDDLLPVNAPKYAKGAFVFTLNEAKTELSVKFSIAQSGTIIETKITDANIINGNQPIVLQAQGNAWRWVVIKVLPNHEHNFGEFQNVDAIGGQVKLCDACNFLEANDVLMQTSDIAPVDGKYLGANAHTALASADNDGEGKIMGAMNYTMSQGKIILPRVQYEKYTKVTFGFGIDHWSNLDCSFGLNTVDDLVDATEVKTARKGAIEVTNNVDGTLKVTVKLNGVVVGEGNVTDKAVSHGMIGLTLLSDGGENTRSFYINYINVEDGKTVYNEHGVSADGKLEDGVKISSYALTGELTVEETLQAPKGFKNVYKLAGLEASGYAGVSCQIGNAKRLFFALYHDASYAYVFGGNNENNPTMWSKDWYYFLIEKTDDGYVVFYKKSYETDWVQKKIDGKTDTNLSSMIRLYNWGGELATANIYSTEVFAQY